jgi:uncharacterized protein YndB with AHSA1/START domain
VARNTIHVDAPPERVFQVLSDPDAYPQWVVGAKAIRGVEGRWPEPGAKFHHAVGFGPLTIRDHTESVASEPPNRLVLKARARPAGTALVTVIVDPERDGSRVTLIEDPGDPFTKLIFNPLTHLLVRGRNTASLERLKDLAERPVANG